MNAPRSLWLSGAVLAAILLARSPLGVTSILPWIALVATALARLALGDRRWLARGKESRWWPTPLFWLPMLALTFVGKDAPGTYMAFLVVLTLPPLPRPAETWHFLHHGLVAAAWLLALELFFGLLRPAGGGSRPSLGSHLVPDGRGIPLGDDPWQALLYWFGLVVVVASVTTWIDRTTFLNRSLRAARDHALRLKLAPHFIFNTLNTLKAQLERDPKEAGATVDRLASLYRQILERTERPTIPLREELAFVESYLGIEQVRLGGRLRVTIDVPEPLDLQEIPTLGLQTLVENAVKHGIAPREDGGALVIRVRRLAGGMLSVAVENPVARGADAGEAMGTGTGLETLRARLLSPSSLRTEAHDGRFLAEFRIPYVEAAT